MLKISQIFWKLSVKEFCINKVRGCKPANDNEHFQKFQKFTCKPQWAYYVCWFACMTALTARHSLIIQNFATLEVHEKWLKQHKTV